MRGEGGGGGGGGLTDFRECCGNLICCTVEGV